MGPSLQAFESTLEITGPRLRTWARGSRTVESLSLYILLKVHGISKAFADAGPRPTFLGTWDEIRTRILRRSELPESLKDLCDSVTALEGRLEGFKSLRKSVEYEIDRHSAKTLYDRLSVAVILLCRISITCDSLDLLDHFPDVCRTILGSLDESIGHQWPPDDLEEIFRQPSTEWLATLQENILSYEHPYGTLLGVRKFRAEAERLHDQLWQLTYQFYSNVTPSIVNEWQPRTNAPDAVAVKVKEILAKPDYEVLLEELRNVHIGVQTLQSVQGTISAHVASQTDALGVLEANTAETQGHSEATKQEIAATVKEATGYWGWNGAAIGASLGAVMGLLLGPAGAVLGCAAGGAAGTATGKVLRARRLTQIEEALAPKPVAKVAKDGGTRPGRAGVGIVPVGIGGCPVSTGMRPF